MDERNELIGNVGEKSFLEHIQKAITVSPDFLNGLNQDASLIKITEDIILVSNIDKAPTPILVSVQGSSYKTWGFLSVTSTLSDICVVGGEGISFLLSLTIPADLETDKIVDLIKGVEEGCNYYNITFLGGDTKKGEHISVVGSANGIIKNNKYLSRHNSKPGDLIITTGVYGEFASAYYKLLNNISLTSAEYEYIKYPKFQIDDVRAINSCIDLFSASMDNSDGLYNLLKKMISENSLGYKIYMDTIPFGDSVIKLSKEQGIPIENFAFYVGDWNSVYTISKKNFKTLKSLINCESLKVIGEVLSSNEGTSFCKNGKNMTLKVDFENDSFTSSFSKSQGFADVILNNESILMSNEV